MGVTERQARILIREMTAADVATVADLEELSFPEPWPAAVFDKELALPRRVYLVAEEEGRVVGYGGMMLVEGDAHVMTIAVHPEHRRRGAATRLMLALIEAALARGAANLTLEVRVSNDAALGLYRKFGFSAVGLRPGYYRDEDAMVMWIVDADGPEYRRRLESLGGGR